MITLFRTIGVLLLLAVVALASALLTMQFVIHSAEVTVPNLKGKTLAQAHRQATALHLDVRVANHLYSSTIPAGHVLNQSPAPGTTVRSGWHMRITESLGPRKVTIPSLTGEPDRVAILKIHQAGLKLAGLAYLPTSRAPSGTVLAQSPQAHAKGVASPRVQLLIATPPSPGKTPGFVMPRLIGKPLAGARRVLASAGLKVARVKRTSLRRRSTGAPQAPLHAGSVIAQSPPSGYRIQPGGAITLTVAK